MESYLFESGLDEIIRIGLEPFLGVGVQDFGQLLLIDNWQLGPTSSRENVDKEDRQDKHTEHHGSGVGLRKRISPIEKHAEYNFGS